MYTIYTVRADFVEVIEELRGKVKALERTVVKDLKNMSRRGAPGASGKEAKTWRALKKDTEVSVEWLRTAKAEALSAAAIAEECYETAQILSDAQKALFAECATRWSRICGYSTELTAAASFGVYVKKRTNPKHWHLKTVLATDKYAQHARVTYKEDAVPNDEGGRDCPITRNSTLYFLNREPWKLWKEMWSSGKYKPEDDGADAARYKQEAAAAKRGAAYGSQKKPEQAPGSEAKKLPYSPEEFPRDLPGEIPGTQEKWAKARSKKGDDGWQDLPAQPTSDPDGAIPGAAPRAPRRRRRRVRRRKKAVSHCSVEAQPNPDEQGQQSGEADRPQVQPAAQDVCPPPNSPTKRGDSNRLDEQEWPLPGENPGQPAAPRPRASPGAGQSDSGAETGPPSVESGRGTSIADDTSSQCKSEDADVDVLG